MIYKKRDNGTIGQANDIKKKDNGTSNDIHNTTKKPKD